MNQEREKRALVRLAKPGSTLPGDNRAFRARRAGSGRRLEPPLIVVASRVTPERVAMAMKEFAKCAQLGNTAKAENPVNSVRGDTRHPKVAQK